MKTLLVLAAFALAVPFTASTALAKECRGFKSAHCFCKTVGWNHVGTAGMPQMNAKGKHFFTFTVPGQCFSPLRDALEYRVNKGCWLACRNAFGVEGHPQHPMVVEAKKAAASALAKQGVCGGYMQAELHFAAGTNKFRNATGSPIAFGLHGWKTVAGKKVCQ
jgi:hypothetical protein